MNIEKKNCAVHCLFYPRRMNESVEKLKAIMAGWEDSIEKARTDIVSAEQEINRLTPMVEAMEIAIKALLAGKPDSTPALTGVGKYAESTLSDAIVDVVASCGPNGLLATEILAKLRAEGFQSSAQNFYASVYSVALNLTKGDNARLVIVERGGKRKFAKKP